MIVSMWKSYMWTLDKEKNMKAILVVMNTSYLRSSESRAWKKNSGLPRICTHDLCDTGAVLYELS